MLEYAKEPANLNEYKFWSLLQLVFICWFIFLTLASWLSQNLCCKRNAAFKKLSQEDRYSNIQTNSSTVYAFLSTVCTIYTMIYACGTNQLTGAHITVFNNFDECYNVTRNIHIWILLHSVAYYSVDLVLDVSLHKPKYRKTSLAKLIKVHHCVSIATLLLVLF